MQQEALEAAGDPKLTGDPNTTRRSQAHWGSQQEAPEPTGDPNSRRPQTHGDSNTTRRSQPFFFFFSLLLFLTFLFLSWFHGFQTSPQILSLKQLSRDRSRSQTQNLLHRLVWGRRGLQSQKGLRWKESSIPECQGLCIYLFFVFGIIAPSWSILG